MLRRNLVMRALQPAGEGTHIVWLDQVLPMYRKDIFAIDAVIRMVKSTNHRFRVTTVFHRIPGSLDQPRRTVLQIPDRELTGAPE
jgi:hypothetical protein